MTGVRKMAGWMMAAAMLPLFAAAPALAQDASASAPAAPAPAAAPAGDATAGQAVFAKCAVCHNIGSGAKNKIGPSLEAVVGRAPGSFPGFAYSAAMKTFAGANPAWTPELLEQFLAGPSKLIPGTKMTFPGLPQQADRDNVIAYLATQTAP